jgi:hypothetical protein
MKLTIIDFAHHRNGICGAPFAVILFEEAGAEGSRKVAILFEPDGHCAVLDVDKLAQGDIAFGSNSWRGDRFEQSLRKTIRISSTPSERS